VEEKQYLYRVNSEKFVTRQMGDEMVMVPLSDSVADMTSVLTLNEVGSDILKALEEPSTIDEVVQKLLTVYDVDKPTLEKDVETFVQEAATKKVIEIINQQRT